MSPHSAPEPFTTLVVTLDSYRFATRSRKSAVQYVDHGPTTFLGLSAAGRAGRWDEPGSWLIDGVRVRQLPVRTPSTGTSRLTQVRNLMFSYAPAYVRLAIATLRTPADVVHVTGLWLATLGWFHTLRHGSRFVLDVTERPGSITQRTSLASLIRYVEMPLLRLVRRRTTVATVVTLGDHDLLEHLGYRKVLFVPNAPTDEWRAPFVAPADSRPDSLDACIIGTVFEGRGYEMLLQAVDQARRSGSDVRVSIYGPGRAEYIDELRALSEHLGLGNVVEWAGPTGRDDVSATYLSHDVGLVLYESDDPGNDGLSNKLMECVSTGRPVIASALPENRRFVEENRVGWLAQTTVAGLTEALVLAARSGTERAEISARCRALGDSRLTWERSFDKVVRSVRER